MATDAANLATIRSSYLSALAADAASPQPSYSIDGESVSQTEWRKHLLDEVERLGRLINSETPYIIRTRHRL